MNSKPGIRTTEFWITAISQLVAAIVVIASGIYGVELEVDVYTRVVATAGVLIQATLTAVWYTRGRTAVKAQDVKAGAVREAYQPRVGQAKSQQ